MVGLGVNYQLSPNSKVYGVRTELNNTLPVLASSAAKPRPSASTPAVATAAAPTPNCVRETVGIVRSNRVVRPHKLK